MIKKNTLHYVTLKLYFSLGLKFKKNSVIEFKQAPWLKPYIDLNKMLSTKAKNDFEKDYYKWMNNSVFGRLMMNKRNFIDIKLYSSKFNTEKLISKRILVVEQFLQNL